MSNDCIIRAARSADYEATCVLFDHLDALHREQLPWLFRAPAERPRTQGHFDAILSSGDSSILLAVETQVVGLVSVRMQQAPDFPVFIPQRWGVIDDVVVLRPWRRRGIGARLARAAENWANERGGAWLELNVYAFNEDARAFYEALGYLPVSTKLRRPLRGAG
jgi:GNAT superfamily N-acetyltransferase